MWDSLSKFAADNSDLAISYAENMITAFVILIVGWMVAGWSRNIVTKALNKRSSVDSTIKPIIANIVRYFILILVIAAFLARFGVQTASIIAVIGAAGLAIGLALQGTLSALAASVMILLLRPFKVGEFIDGGGVAGTVDEIGLFLSRLRTADGIYISVPNSQLWGAAITNYSRLPTRRIVLPVGIGYGDNIDQAQAVLMSIIAKDDRIHDEPGPEVIVNSLDDSAVTLNMRCWVDRENYWGALLDMTKAVKISLDDAGVSIPYPQQDVHMIARPAA
ncbi:MAG TPA: mechanosensitive ion channel [Sneathiellales bacterium]|nr:mechanosensitive ion channel [Sneathiellales bacterium]